MHKNAKRQMRNIDDGSAVADLMRCFLQAEVSTKEFPELTRKMQWVKHTEEGVSTMSAVIERYYGEELQEARKEALEKGQAKGAKLTKDAYKRLAEAMKHGGYSSDDLVRIMLDEAFCDEMMQKFGIS